MSRTLTFTTQAAAQTAQGQIEARIYTFCAADGYAVDGSGNVSPKVLGTGAVDSSGAKTTTWCPVSGSGSAWSIPHPEYHTLRRDLVSSVAMNFISYVMQDQTSPTLSGTASTFDPLVGTAGGWSKVSGQHISTLGGPAGTLFDPWVINDGGTYKMWVSHRDSGKIAYATSADGGFTWTTPVDCALTPTSGWSVSRASVIKMAASDYRIWYTEQQGTTMRICYATGSDGVNWTPYSGNPIMTAQAGWESQVDVAIGQPVVVLDSANSKFRMWYAGGASFEPVAIGYAESADGITWTRNGANPIFQADTTKVWEQGFVGVGCVFPSGGFWIMFYIAYQDANTATIGAARSTDGITNWERHALNPLIRKSQISADQDNTGCYRPTVYFDSTANMYKLWYNGRNAGLNPPECIMMATLPGANLWF